MSWGADKQAVSLKGDQRLSVKEKGPALLRLPDKSRVCSQPKSRGDDHDQTLRAGPTSMQHTDVFPYLRKMHCCNQWDPKSDNDNLMGVQREGPEHSLGFTVNTQRKHCTRAFIQLLLRNHPQLATQLLYQDSLR